MTKLFELVAKHVQQLVPYASARRLFKAADQDGQAPLWLNANESPYTSGYTVNCDVFNRYPDCQPTALLQAYADYTNLSPDNILVSRGADEGIELLIRTFCNAPQDKILICPPTYGMYAISAETANIGITSVPLTAELALDVTAICAAEQDIKLVFICSPNNPTGNLMSPADILSVVQHYQDKALVVLDEAYIEFTPQATQQALLNDYPHVVILRTLSKAFSLAGLRCGFTLAHADVIASLLKVIAPYPISAPVAQIVQQALTPAGLQTMRTRVSEINQAKQQMVAQLQTFPSVSIVGGQSGNYILFRTPRAAQLMQALVVEKIFIRDQSKQLQLSNCLRITIGSSAENARLMTAMSRFFEE